MAILTSEEAASVSESLREGLRGLLGKFNVKYDDREDVIQEATTKFLQYLGKDVSNPRGLLFFLVRREAVDWVRQDERGPKRKNLDIDFVPTANNAGYQMIGGDTAKKHIQRLIALYPGADAQAVALRLEFGSFEKAAIALLEREGLEPEAVVAKKKAHALRKRFQEFKEKIGNLDKEEMILLSLFDMRNLAVVVETLIKPYGYKNRSEKTKLSAALDAHENIHIEEVAQSPFNRSMTLNSYSFVLKESIQDHIDHAIKLLHFSHEAYDLGCELNDGILVSNSLDFITHARGCVYKSCIHKFSEVLRIRKEKLSEEAENELKNILGYPSALSILWLSLNCWLVKHDLAHIVNELVVSAPPVEHYRDLGVHPDFGIKSLYHGKATSKPFDGEHISLWDLWSVGVSSEYKMIRRELNPKNPIDELDLLLQFADTLLRLGMTEEARRQIVEVRMKLEGLLGKSLNEVSLDTVNSKSALAGRSDLEGR